MVSIGPGPNNFIFALYHGPMNAPDRQRLQALVDLERSSYHDLHPRSRALREESVHLLGGVPMTWMSKWAGGFPLGFLTAHGATITDLDGHELVDFALGDTGAMAGHSPKALVDALARRVAAQGGVTTMLPNEDGEWVGAELARRFGLSRWSFSLSATDANRWMLRLARLVTGESQGSGLLLLVSRHRG